MKKLWPVLFLLIFCLLGFFLISISPLDKTGQSNDFVINQGDGLATISNRLQKNQLIRQRHVFIIYSYYLGLNKKLQAGSFQLSPAMSVKKIIATLSQGGSYDYWFKIQAGWRLEEIVSSFPDNLPFSASQFIIQAKDQEGQLFPDSYLIPQDYNIDQILQLISRNFDKKFTQAKSQSRQTNLSDRQIIVLASLLEREAKTLTDQQMVAGIIQNRLNLNMALQLDATAQHARDSATTPAKYWQPPTKIDLRSNSAYNTYQHTGLPPGPICNPGLDALTAAFNPTDSDYLYYISDNSGGMHYATTLEEHNQNIQNYLR